MSELNLCPFCEVNTEIAKNGRGYYFVYCPECNEESDYCLSKDDAIAAWNKRVKKAKK